MFRRGNRIRDMLLLSGWLFADLLLALMMIFMISINGVEPPKLCATPLPGTPAATTATPGALAPSHGDVLFKAADTQATSSAGNGAAFPTPTPCPVTPTPTSTPFPCGLDVNNPQYIPAQQAGRSVGFDVNDPAGLIAHTDGGQQSFANQVQGLFASYKGQIAGFVEVFGADPANAQNPSAGENYAQDAIDAIKAKLEQQVRNQNSVFVQNKTYYQNFWDGNIGGGQIRIFALFYLESTNNGTCA